MRFDDLRTPNPMREADYAAVRARVRGEIARRAERRWFWLTLRFAGVAALVALAFSVLLTTRRTEPAKTVAPLVAAAPTPAPTPAPAPVPAPAPDPERVLDPKPEVPRPVFHARATVPTRRADPMTIHIQTADPEVRIIWIVNPNTKEES